SGGADFFERRVTDDPLVSLLYDPQHEPGAVAGAATAGNPASPPSTSSNAQLSFEEEQQPPAQPGQVGTPVVAPRSGVNVEALSEAGLLVISGNNPADVEAVLQIVQLIPRVGAASEVQITVVPLEQADATSVVNTLNQVYSRVNVTGAGLIAAPVPRTTTTQAGLFGASQTSSQASSVVLVPLPRFNSILMAVAKSRV